MYVSRLRRLVTTGKIFFVTCNVKKGVKQLSPSERNLFLAAVAEARAKHKFRLLAYVVMPTHWHALLLPAPEKTIGDIMHAIKRLSAFHINKRRGTSGSLWQARFYDSFARKVKDFGAALEYIHTNPVRDGFVSDPARWPWSSYAQLVTGKNSFPAVDRLELPLDPEYRL